MVARRRGSRIGDVAGTEPDTLADRGTEFPAVAGLAGSKWARCPGRTRGTRTRVEASSRGAGEVRRGQIDPLDAVRGGRNLMPRRARSPASTAPRRCCTGRSGRGPARPACAAAGRRRTRPASRTVAPAAEEPRLGDDQFGGERVCSAGSDDSEPRVIVGSVAAPIASVAARRPREARPRPATRDRARAGRGPPPRRRRGSCRSPPRRSARRDPAATSPSSESGSSMPKDAGAVRRAPGPRPIGPAGRRLAATVRFGSRGCRRPAWRAGRPAIPARLADTATG